MKKNIIIGLLILVPIIVAPVVYFQHDRIETLFSSKELETVNWNELNKTGDLYYKKLTDIPFTGIAEGKEESDDDWTTRSPIRDGLKNGMESSYYKDGQLSSKGNWKNGKREGTWAWYHKNGQLDYKGNFKNDKREGTRVEYHDNGQLSSKGNWNSGEREGAWVFFNKDGTKRMSERTRFGFTFDEGSGVYRNGMRVSD